MAPKRARKPTGQNGTEELSGLIFNNLKMAPEPKNIAEEKIKLQELKQRAANRQKISGWMYFMVTMVALMVVSLWIYSFYSQISFLNWHDSPESALINTSQKSWQNAFNLPTAPQTTNKNLVKEKLQVIAQTLKQQIPASAAPTTTTAETLATPTTTTSTL